MPPAARIVGSGVTRDRAHRGFEVGTELLVIALRLVDEGAHVGGVAVVAAAPGHLLAHRHDIGKGRGHYAGTITAASLKRWTSRQLGPMASISRSVL